MSKLSTVLEATVLLPIEKYFIAQKVKTHYCSHEYGLQPQPSYPNIPESLMQFKQLIC